MQVLDTVDLDAIRALHEREEFFWLDLDSPGDADLDALGALLEIPDLAIEDSKEFGQRPKLDDYGERVLIVFYGAHETELVEVHVHVSGKEVVTIRRAPCAHLWEARERAATARSAPSRISSTACSTPLPTRCERSPTATRRRSSTSRRSPSSGPSRPTAGA